MAAMTCYTHHCKILYTDYWLFVEGLLNVDYKCQSSEIIPSNAMKLPIVKATINATRPSLSRVLARYIHNVTSSGRDSFSILSSS